MQSNDSQLLFCAPLWRRAAWRAIFPHVTPQWPRCHPRYGCCSAPRRREQIHRSVVCLANRDNGKTPPNSDEDDHAAAQRALKQLDELGGSTNNTEGNRRPSNAKKTRRPRVLTRLKKPGLAALGLYGVYIAIGCVYFSRAEQWDIGDALYFTIQTGLGVGYGDLLPSHAASTLFTSAYVMIGNVFYAAALALFVESEFRIRDDLLARLQRTSASALPTMRTQEERRRAMRAHEEESMRGFTLLFRDIRQALRTLRRLTPGEIFAAVVEYAYLSENSTHSTSNDTGVELFKRDVRRLIANFTRSIIGRAAFSYALLVLWIVIGTLYAHVVEHHNLPYSLLFSVSCITTFGIVAPDEAASSRWFSVLFTASGFAIYLNSVGKIAGLLVEQYEMETRDREAHSESAPPNATLRELTPWHHTDPAEEQRRWTSFLERELSRRGYVDRETLASIYASYENDVGGGVADWLLDDDEGGNPGGEPPDRSAGRGADSHDEHDSVDVVYDADGQPLPHYKSHSKRES